MKKSLWLFAGFVAIVWGLFVASPGMAQERVYRMTGQISAIEAAYNTVVIEIPMGERWFTVGGPLAAQAVLQKGGQPATLADFSLGDEVTVKWRATERDHVIEMLAAN